MLPRLVAVVLALAFASCGGPRPLSLEESSAVDRFVAGSKLFDEPGRRCAALRAVRTVGVGGVDALLSGGVVDASAAEVWFGAFARCVRVDETLVAAITAPATPTAAELSCVVKAKPLRDDVKPIVVARLAGREAPAISAAGQSRLADAYGKCLSAEQRHLLGQ